MLISEIKRFSVQYNEVQVNVCFTAGLFILKMMFYTDETDHCLSVLLHANITHMCVTMCYESIICRVYLKLDAIKARTWVKCVCIQHLQPWPNSFAQLKSSIF